MADFPQISPTSTGAAERGYTPISGAATAALIVACITALTITGFGVAAAISRKPFLSGIPLLMAAASVVVALAAKLHVARSGGTRAGSKMANAALLIALVFGLGYGAYWFAIDFALRKQSEEFTSRFIKLLIDGEEEKAFRLTRAADQQRALADDPETIRRRYGSSDLGVFARSDLPRLLRTWKGKMEFELLGVRNWTERPGGYEVDLSCRFRFPEGEYVLNTTAIGMDDPDTGGRTWQIFWAKTGMDPTRTRYTRLGLLILQLQFDSFQKLAPWLAKLGDRGSAAIEPMIRLEGHIPPADKRAQMAKELVKPGAINYRPGGPLKPLGLAGVYFTDDHVYLTHLVEVSIPTIGSEASSLLTVDLQGEKLVSEMLKLAGPGWQQQPFVTDMTPILPEYKYHLEPITLNIRPSSGRLSLRPIPTPG